MRNRTDGAVEALIVGDDNAVGEMIDACRRGPPMARVDNVDIEPVDLDVLPQGFTQLPTADCRIIPPCANALAMRRARWLDRVMSAGT